MIRKTKLCLVFLSFLLIFKSICYNSNSRKEDVEDEYSTEQRLNKYSKISQNLINEIKNHEIKVYTCLPSENELMCFLRYD